MPKLVLQETTTDTTSRTATTPKPSTNNVVGKNLWWMLDNIVTVPDAWVQAGGTGGDVSGLSTIKCESYAQVVDAFREAMLWTPGLDKGLAVMLAVVSSTVMTGDQLWAKILSPPASGKTTIAEAVAVATKYVFSTSIFRGFHSGFGSEDNSLIDKVRGKTLIVKDGDTLLQAPNLHQILAEARDVYDTVSRAHYRTGKSAEYNNVRTTFILCGTSSLKSIDASEAGERFLDCVLMDGIDDDLEDQILLRVADNSDDALNYESTDDFESQGQPEMVKAKQLTGGYVEYLRQNTVPLMQAIKFSPEAKYKCARYGKMVAHLRSRPSKKQDEHHEREFAPRLVSQLVRLAKCLAVVLQKPSVDSEVLERVRAIALDTCKGRGLDIVQTIRKSEEPSKGMDYGRIALMTGMEKSKCYTLIKFFREINVLETHKAKGESKIRWRVKAKFNALCDEVLKPVESDNDEVPF